jgi:predicted Zn-dependent peptidase
MIARTYPSKAVKACVLTLLLSLALGMQSPLRAAQGTPEPTREELLNGLRILIRSQSGSPNVMLKLRIHSGAAFDLLGKTGTMAMLGDVLFPDPETREFFTEELGGSLEVTTNYDAIDIKMIGRASEFERMLELLRVALVNTPITNENVARLRDARIKMVRDLSVAPSTIADRAIAKRLFGEYPYGRPAAGATDTLAKLDRTDLMLARERFLTPDNATLIVVGGVEERRAMRALRQLLGTWRKSDKRVPATFRQPDAPDARTLIVDLPGTENVEVRLATRGFARAERDYAAAMLLALLARDRWQTAFPELGKNPFFVRHDSHLLSGMFIMGASVRTTESAQALESARNVLRALTDSQPSAAELERARSEALAIINKGSDEPATLARIWLDAESYKLDANSGDQTRALNKVTTADLQRVAARLFRDAAFASVAVGSAAQIKADLERAGKVEILGETVAPKTTNAAPPSKNP